MNRDPMDRFPSPPCSAERAAVSGMMKGGRGDYLSERLRAWYKASRPPFYVATFVPLALGFVLAGKHTGTWLWVRFLIINLGAFMVHLATNLADDLFDHIQGTDAGDSIGGSRVIQEGLISLPSLATALIILYGGALAVAVWLVRLSGQTGLWIPIVFAALSSLFYVAPPIRYGYRALGEASVFLNMGLVMVGGSYWVLAEGLRPELVLYSIPVGLMVSNILYFQSLPDRETDAAVGKRTLAVHLDKAGCLLAFRLWWAGTWASLSLLFILGLAAWPCLGWILTLPLYARADRLIRSTENWLDLDRHGHLIRKMYLANGALLVIATALA